MGGLRRAVRRSDSDVRPLIQRVRRAGHVASGCALALLVSSWAGPARAELTGALLDALQIGSRADLGLGGDPFLSVCLAETGGWQVPGGRAVRFSMHQQAPITQRLSGRRGELVSHESRLSLREGYDFQTWRLHGELSVGRRLRDHLLVDEKSELRVEEEGTLAAARLEARVFRPDLRARIEIPFGQAGERCGRAPFVCGVLGAFGQRFWLSGEWRSAGYEVPFDTTVEEEFVHASLNSRETALRSAARARLWHGLSLEASYHEERFRQDAGLTGEFHDEFLPAARAYLRQVSLEWRRLASRCDLLVRHTDFDLQASAEGYWGGQRYLRLTRGRGEIDDWLAAAQVHLGRTRVLADFETSDFACSGRADVEGWRFDLSDFLAGKKVLQGGGDGVSRRLRLAAETSRSWGRLRGGVTWYEIRPRLEAESWIKVVFIREDYERWTLASDRYSLAAVSLGAEWVWADVSFQVGLHQFVHFDDHRRASIPGPENPDARPATGWYGGTFLDVVLERRF